MLFKCIQNGNVFEFNNENDIKEMLKHSEYTPVEAALEEAPKEEALQNVGPTKRKRK